MSEEYVECYPFNMAAAIFSYPLVTDLRRIEGLASRVDPDKLCDVVKELSEREQDALALRFKSKLTLKECGDSLGLSAERARQIIAKALRRMRQPDRIKQYRLIPMLELETSKEHCRELEREVEILKCKLEKYETEEEIQDSLELKEEVDIAELDLSVRAYNCLRRAGYRTLTDCRKLTVKKMMKIRNLGKRSLEETLDTLKKWGITVPEE